MWPYDRASSSHLFSFFPSLSVITFFFSRTLRILIFFADARQALTYAEVLSTAAENLGSTGRNSVHSDNHYHQTGSS